MGGGGEEGACFLPAVLPPPLLPLGDFLDIRDGELPWRRLLVGGIGRGKEGAKLGSLQRYNSIYKGPNVTLRSELRYDPSKQLSELSRERAKWCEAKWCASKYQPCGVGGGDTCFSSAGNQLIINCRRNS